MTTLPPLDELGLALTHAGESSFNERSLEFWGNPGLMSKALALITKRFDDPVIKSDKQSVSRAILRYRQTRLLTDFVDIKYVCIGVWDSYSGWCLLEDQELLQSLLIAAQNGPTRRRLKYFSCLLRSYLTFPRFSEKATPASLTGWMTLRDWLSAQERKLAPTEISKPLWFRTIHEHRNLLGDNPCQRYQKDLLLGGSGELNDAFAKLAVPADSWLREEAIFAQIQAGINLSDAAFQSCLGRLLTVATGQSDFKLSRGLSIRCVALLISRYAACASNPEHIALRDAALSFIGNPWLHRSAWDSRVVLGDGQPDVEAREMINGWLKVRLIRDFFDLLSEDRSADSRRLNYWLRFEPMIDDMWFVLGADAINDKRKDYVDFRLRAKGRLLDLVGSTPTQNNAFLMRIGEYVVVEFGLKGNACFAYEYDALSADLKRRLSSEIYRAQVDIDALKVKGHKPRKVHIGQWEAEFDREFCPRFGFRPPPHRGSRTVSPKSTDTRFVVVNKQASPSRTPSKTYGGVRVSSRVDFDRFVSNRQLKVEDYRMKGGSLWVRTDNADPTISSELRTFGFTYKPGKGWWWTE